MKTTEPDLIYSLLRGFLAIILFLLSIRASARSGNKSEAPYFFVISSTPGLDELPLNEVDFSFHKKIELPEEFEKTLSDKIGKHIETNLMKSINKFLGSTSASLLYIDVTVGADGKVKVILFKGEISQKEMAVIEAMIMKQLYAEFKIGKSWNYKIIFR